MTLEELEHHWKTYRASTNEEILSEQALCDLLPPESTFSYRRILTTMTRYAAVYGSIFLCCQSC